ncbi:MAG: hypothetical protein ACM3UR_05750 [Bacteroidota bacterium]
MIKLKIGNLHFSIKMAVSWLPAFLLLIALSGCASTTDIGKYQNKDEYFNTINEQSKDRYALITLLDGQAFRVHNLNIGTDTTSWSDDKADDRISIQTSKLYSIQVTDRIGGLTHGLVYGILAGALAGASYALLIGKTSEVQEPPVLLGAIGGALVGAVSGTIIGVTVGEPSYFIINQRESK